MKVQWITVWLTVLLAIGCSDEPVAQESYTLCDCVNYPPNTDAKLSACSALIESMDQGEMVSQSMACKKEVPVPAGGPDMCYCMHGESDDPAVRAQCEALFENVTTGELVDITRRCAAERVRNQ